MNETKKFESECREGISLLGKNDEIKKLTNTYIKKLNKLKYSYHFKHLGRPIIQYPQDIVALQEIIWEVKPDLIIETGIAHGGSLILSASMLALIDMSEAIESNVTLNPAESKRKVIGIDIDIREHNKIEIEKHPMSSRIQMIQGPSTDSKIVEKVKNIAKKYNKILICLDSNHTHEHVLNELNAYASLTSIDSYCVVMDTIVEDIGENYDWVGRDWSIGNNPKTAVFEFLKENNNFEIDNSIDNKLQISVAPDGYLKRVK